MRSQASQDLRRPLRRSRNRQRQGKVIDAAERRGYISGPPQLLQRVSVTDGRNERERSPAIRHLESLATFGQSQHAARILAELADADRPHVLLVALCDGLACL